MTKAKNYTWHKLADSFADLSLADNGMQQLIVGGKTICIAHHKDQLFACTAKCPHAGGELARGYLDALGNIVCPLHRYKFSLQNGRNISGEGYFLKTFPVEIREDGIYVGFEAHHFLGWFR